MRRTYVRVITIVIAVCGLVGFGLLWWVGCSFQLQRLSRELLAGKSTEQAIALSTSTWSRWTASASCRTRP